MNIHTTIGLYANGNYKINGVHPNDLDIHVEYNKQFRPGRSLFVDGKCVYRGYHTEQQVIDFEERIRLNPEQFTATKLSETYY